MRITQDDNHHSSYYVGFGLVRHRHNYINYYTDWYWKFKIIYIYYSFLMNYNCFDFDTILYKG